MVRLRRIAAILALAGITGSAQAQAVQIAKPCIPGPEAAGLILFLAPELLKTVGTSCANALPANAVVRQQSGPLIDKYRAAADGSWETAKQAIAKLGGENVRALIDSDQFRPLVSTMVAPLILKKINVKDCPHIERVVSLMAPLPPRNVADLIVTIVQIADKGKPDSKFPICPADLK